MSYTIREEKEALKCLVNCVSPKYREAVSLQAERVTPAAQAPARGTLHPNWTTVPVAVSPQGSDRGTLCRRPDVKAARSNGQTEGCGCSNITLFTKTEERGLDSAHRVSFADPSSGALLNQTCAPSQACTQRPGTASLLNGSGSPQWMQTWALLDSWIPEDRL